MQIHICPLIKELAATEMKMRKSILKSLSLKNLDETKKNLKQPIL
jgi:hypothetical protein